MTATAPALVEDTKTGMMIRLGGAGEGDAYILRERKQYLALKPQPDDVLLDLGASIGSVSSLFSPIVSKVFAFEPEPENFGILQHNSASLENVELWAVAVVGRCEPQETRVLYVAGGKNLGLHSLTPTRGRGEVRVPVAQFSRVLEYARPTLLKVDVEGAEYDLIEDFEAGLPSYVRGLALELHLTKPGWREHFAPRMMAAIANNQFAAVRVPHFTSQNWATLGVWLR
jgi:FkbM family methyltransferase